ncbi:MAG TPA: hypothetical protein VHZ07_24235 [Bryobacteraceae bacterium]|jgi:hypothetical protein|nr:hypothetical protein [Bryobacteraceae bacterium]
MISLADISLLTLAAIAAGIAILIAFRRFSNRKSLALAKRQVWAQLYALRLYSDEPSLIWQIQKRLFVWNGRYLFQMLRPVAVVIVPLSALLFLLDGFYGHRPLRNGETALVSIRSLNQAPSLTGHNVSIETPALRVPGSHIAYWRIRAGSASGDLIFAAHREPVHVGSSLAYISACPRCFGKSIDVLYPLAYIDMFGYQVPWLLWFLIISAATMLILRKRFRVMF